MEILCSQYKGSILALPSDLAIPIHRCWVTIYITKANSHNHGNWSFANMYIEKIEVHFHPPQKMNSN